MSHMVIFRTPEGKPGYQPAETVQDAVAVVERLRNDEGVENVRIFRLEELQFEYRPYYKVEIAGLADTDDENVEASLDAGVETEAEASTTADTEVVSEPTDSATNAMPAEGAIEASHEEVSAEPTSAESDAEAVESTEPAATSEHPPWAAPPPPPPPAPGFGNSDDEFSGTGQRRGLFGR